MFRHLYRNTLKPKTKMNILQITPIPINTPIILPSSGGSSGEGPMEFLMTVSFSILIAWVIITFIVFLIEKIRGTSIKKLIIDPMGIDSGATWFSSSIVYIHHIMWFLMIMLLMSRGIYNLLN